MARQTHQRAHDVGPYKTQEFPATELAAALGLYPSDRDSFNYSQTLALKERLVDVCKRCAIRFGLPDQTRKHLGDAIGLPNEPVLRYPHREIPIDPRWEALANALRFPSPGDFPLVHVEVPSAEALNAIKSSLPSLLEDIDLPRRSRQDSSGRATFSPISREVGDALIDKMEKVKSFGDTDTSPEGYNRTLARNTYRQMRIYLALGPEWTLVSSLENLALKSHTLPPPGSSPSSKKTPSATITSSVSPTPRWNRTDNEPQTAPAPLLGLTWKWVRHEGKHLPPAWGGPQAAPWGRWEPQFPDTDKPNTSLFGHSSVYIQLDLENQHFRDAATRKLLTSLRRARMDFEESRRDGRRDGTYSENLETILTARLIRRQEEVLDACVVSKTSH